MFESSIVGRPSLINIMFPFLFVVWIIAGPCDLKSQNASEKEVPQNLSFFHSSLVPFKWPSNRNNPSFPPLSELVSWPRNALINLAPTRPTKRPVFCGGKPPACSIAGTWHLYKRIPACLGLTSGPIFGKKVDSLRMATLTGKIMVQLTHMLHGAGICTYKTGWFLR